MNHRKVIAIIRDDTLEKVEAALQQIGVHGMSVSEVRGYGEYANYYAGDLMVEHSRIEIFTCAEEAETIAQTIIDAAYIGMEGDGIVAILPVEKLYRIRTRSEITKGCR